MTFAQSQMERFHMQQVIGDVSTYTHLLLVRLTPIPLHNRLLLYWIYQTHSDLTSHRSDLHTF